MAQLEWSRTNRVQRVLEIDYVLVREGMSIDMDGEVATWAEDILLDMEDDIVDTLEYLYYADGDYAHRNAEEKWQLVIIREYTDSAEGGYDTTLAVYTIKDAPQGADYGWLMKVNGTVRPVWADKVTVK